MTNLPEKDTMKDLIRYNINPLVILILLITVVFWGTSSHWYATFSFLLLLLVFTIQNVWYAYKKLFE